MPYHKITKPQATYIPASGIGLTGQLEFGSWSQYCGRSLEANPSKLRVKAIPTWRICRIER